MQINSEKISRQSNRSIPISILVMFGWSFGAQAEPTLFEDNAYEFIVSPDILWGDAKSDAEQLSFAGVSGHLVTIFNSGENGFVLSLLEGVSNSAWIGASDSDTEGEWRWVTGEQFWQGAENGMSGPDVFFANWGPGEPNDFDGDEDHGLIIPQLPMDPTFPQFNPGDWNDLANFGDASGLFSISGYVVEYDQPLNGLIEKVMNLNINQGIQNSLDGKLNAVLQALDDMNTGNDVAAINALQAFINAVEAQRGNQIPVTDADAFIQAAQAFINALTM